MIDQFPRSSGGGQCPPLRGIDHPATKGHSPRRCSNEQAGRPACRHDDPYSYVVPRVPRVSPTHRRHRRRRFKGLDRSLVSVPTPVIPLKRDHSDGALFARIKVQRLHPFHIFCAHQAERHGLQRAHPHFQSRPFATDRH
jgi:hypothetical protein